MVLRLADFIAVIVRDPDDINNNFYANNGGDAFAASIVSVDGLIYIGGAPAAANVPFDQLGVSSHVEKRRGK